MGLERRFVREGRETRFVEMDRVRWEAHESKLVPLEVRKGALVVLHGRVPHMSHANRSPRSRHAYTLHVVDARSAYPGTNWLRRRATMPLRGF
jgi:phytanoyl-CoA hydroxylase